MRGAGRSLIGPIYLFGSSGLGRHADFHDAARTAISQLRHDYRSSSSRTLLDSAISNSELPLPMTIYGVQCAPYYILIGTIFDNYKKTKRLLVIGSRFYHGIDVLVPLPVKHLHISVICF